MFGKLFKKYLSVWKEERFQSPIAAKPLWASIEVASNVRNADGIWAQSMIKAFKSQNYADLTPQTQFQNFL